jgi:PAS domain S-box-containing protein
VVLPVSQWQLASTAVLNRTFYVLLSLLFAGFLVIWFSVRGLRHSLLDAKTLSGERKTAIEQLSEQINERVAVERDLRLSESKLNSIFQSVPEAIVVADTQGRIVQCNGATSAMFGHPMEALLGQRIQVLMSAQEQQQHDGYMATYLSSGEARMMNQPRVVQGQRSDGTLFPVRLTISETRVDQGHFFVGVMQDFTAIHNAQALLVEAKNKAEQDNRLRGEFLANMSHEIRTPMNGILGMTELALGTDDTRLHKEYLTLARDSANHLLHIINEILDFSKIEANALELECLPVSPAQLIRHTARSLEQLANTKGVALWVETEPSVPDWVLLDPVRMRQVLTNLIGNAIKFTDVGHVRVSTSCEPTDNPQVVAVCIRIADTGVGFDPSRKEALFSPFTQADGSVTRSFGGTGLGLAITRRLLQLMGGDVTADATPGQGAVFEVRLPLRLATQDVVQPVDAAPERLGQAFDRRLSVLLVEDHEINRKLAEIMLARTGCDCVCAKDGEEALAVLAQRDFDVVLMDVMMPVMDGLSALRVLREREVGTGRRTAVLMVTAHAMTGDRERFLAAGADGYVSKPMSQVVLEREIRRVLGSGL